MGVADAWRAEAPPCWGLKSMWQRAWQVLSGVPETSSNTLTALQGNPINRDLSRSSEHTASVKGKDFMSVVEEGCFSVFRMLFGDVSARFQA